MRDYVLCIAKQIKLLEIFDDPYSIANNLVERHSEITSLSIEQIEALKWIKTTFVKDNSEVWSSDIIAEAMFVGKGNINDLLSDIAAILNCSVEDLHPKISKNPHLLLSSREHLGSVYDLLDDIGLSLEQIKTVFLDALLLNNVTLRERCDFVLKFYSTDDLVYLVTKCGFFQDMHYYDFVEAIAVAIDTLGAQNVMNFLHAYPSFLLECRAKEYRSLPSDVFLYEDAMKSLSNYKNSLK